MEVLSPVGRFPMRLRSVRIRDGRIALDTRMGAWRSEVVFGPEDLPLGAGAAAALLVAFALGRRRGKERTRG